jgi:hypothetical protein
MPRPKKYANAADRQAAFRARTKADFKLVEKAVLEDLNFKLQNLHATIFAARQAGDALAFEVYSGSLDTTLDRLTDEFRARTEFAARGELLPPAPKQKKDRAKSS